MSDPWYEYFPFRFEHKGDVPLCSEDFELNIKSKSKLSPITNLVLNIISIPNDRSNYIITVPSSILRPLPLMAYILATKSKGSVLVFSNYKVHYNNYHLIKLDYQFIWNKIPAGEIKKNSIYVDPLIPRHAKKSYKDQIPQYIPLFKKRFLDSNYSKILFCHSKNLRFNSSIEDVFVGTENILSKSNITDLGIKTVIFENLDKIVYNNYLFEVFKVWIDELKNKGIQFIFHFANPDYKFLADMKNYFSCYVMYFPYSFLKSNEHLMEKNKHYSVSTNIVASTIGGVITAITGLLY